MDARLYANITTLVLSEKLNSDSGYSFPKLVAGKTLELKLTLSQKIEEAWSLSDRTVHGIKASIGRLDARPETGTFQLMIGDAPEAENKITGDIPYNATVEQLRAALEAVTSLPAEAKDVSVVAEKDARGNVMAYRIRFADGVARTITCVDNALWPLCFVEVTVSEHDEGWIHRLKLTQALAAETVDLTYKAARDPYVERKQEGGSTEGSSWNEIQKIIIPPEFNTGSFQVRRAFKRSALIGLPTNAAEIADAIKTIADDGGEFIVTEEQDAVVVEFGGAMKGTSQSLLEIAVFESPKPALAILIDTDTAAMDIIMQRPDANTGEVKLPMEIQLDLEDEANAEVLHAVAFRTELTFLRPLNVAARNAAAMVNWNQPLTLRDTRPYGPGQFLIGQRHALFVVGNGVHHDFTLNHNLDDATVGVRVRDNADAGRLLPESEYTVTFDGLNAIRIDFGDVVPDPNSLVVIITTASHPATFVAHQHTIADILGLEARLTAIEEQLAKLNAIAPSGGLTVDTTETTEAVAQWTLPNFVDIYPTRVSLALPVTTVNSQGQSSSSMVTAPKSIAEITPAWLQSLGIRDGGLLPAIHRTNVVELNSINDFGTDYEGTVFQNVSGGDIKIPGKKGRSKDVVADGEFIAYHQGVWYQVINAQGTRSYFPRQFERTLFEIPINALELRHKKTLTIPLGFEAAIVTNLAASLEQMTNSPRLAEAQWTLVFEWGEYGEEELTPDDDQDEVRDTAPNLEQVLWHYDTPLLKHRFILSTVPAIKEFGIQIMVDAAGNIFANKVIAKGKEAAPTYTFPAPTEEDPDATEERSSVPTTRDFAIRARLIEFDTRNVWLPQGLVVLIGLDRGTGSSIGKNGIAEIK